MRRIEIYGFRFALVGASLVILLLSIMPGDVASVKIGNDKLGHMMAFFVMAFLADFSFPKTRFTVWKVVALLGFGLLIELLQMSIPSRTFSSLDLLADAVGLVMYQIGLPGIRRLPLLRKRWQTEIELSSID